LTKSTAPRGERREETTKKFFHANEKDESRNGGPHASTIPRSGRGGEDPNKKKENRERENGVFDDAIPRKRGVRQPCHSFCTRNGRHHLEIGGGGSEKIVPLFG